MHKLTLVVMLCLLSSFVYTQRRTKTRSRRTTTARPAWSLPTSIQRRAGRQFFKGKVCKGGLVAAFCPRLSSVERSLFKTQFELRQLANQAGVLPASSGSIFSAGGQTIGCGNYLDYDTEATTITDVVSGDQYYLAHIPPGCNGCNGPLYQMVFFNDCKYNSCCGGEGTCSPRPVPMNYIDSGWKLITVRQVLFCDCLNRGNKK